MGRPTSRSWPPRPTPGTFPGRPTRLRSTPDADLPQLLGDGAIHSSHLLSSRGQVPQDGPGHAQEPARLLGLRAGAGRLGALDLDGPTQGQGRTSRNGPARKTQVGNPFRRVSRTGGHAGRTADLTKADLEAAWSYYHQHSRDRQKT